MSSVIDSVLNTVRLVSDAGLRLLAHNPIGVARDTAQEEIEERWADIEREVANIVRDRNPVSGAALEPAGNAAVTAQPAPAPVPARQGGWGPMP